MKRVMLDTNAYAALLSGPKVPGFMVAMSHLERGTL